MTKKEIGVLINKTRLQAKMTQQQLSEAIGGNHKQYIPKIEKGNTNITVDKLLKICEVLKLKIEIYEE